MTAKPLVAEESLNDVGAALVVSAYENHKAHARFQETQRSWVMAGFIAFSSGLLTIVASENFVSLGPNTTAMMLLIHMAFCTFTGIALVKLSQERGRHFRQAEAIVAAAGTALQKENAKLARMLKACELNTLVYTSHPRLRSWLALFSVSAAYSYFVSLFLTIDVGLLMDLARFGRGWIVATAVALFFSLNLLQHRFSRWLRSHGFHE